MPTSSVLEKDRRDRTYPAVSAAPRWLRIAFVTAVCALAAIRFVHLKADFPDYSLWMEDQAKFTDEGWWAQGVVMHLLLGHWNVPGDYNPAAAAPVWPLLLAGLFHFTGLSLVAARALCAAFSIGTLAAVYALVRRYSAGEAPAMLATLLLAASPFAFVFSRLAILETLVIFEFCVVLLAASCASARRAWPLIAVAIGVTVMFLSKATSVLLVPAVCWVAWRAMGRSLGGLARAAIAAALVPYLLVKTYAAWIAHLGYGADYHYFFDVNAMPEIDWGHTFSTVADLLSNCVWVDRVLYPAGLAILVLSVAWKRRLWRNPLFTACWMAIAAVAAFVFSRQDDYAPRYFLFMMPPLVMLVSLAFGEFMQNTRWLAGAVLAAVVFAFALNAWMIAGFVRKPTYRFFNAAQDIQRIVDSDPAQHRMILGVSGSQLSLMTGIPSISDVYSTADLSANVARYDPGWYLAWNGAENRDLLAPFDVQLVASYNVFDDDDRNKLILYRLVKRGAAPR